MAIWSDETVTRFTNRGEDIFLQEFPVLINRVALSIVAGTSQYTLEDSVHSIRRITWKGIKIEPTSFRKFRNLNAIGTEQGRPTEYLYDNIGKQVIQFFPTPNETIASTATNLFGAAIKTNVIIEFYTSGAVNRDTVTGDDRYTVGGSVRNLSGEAVIPSAIRDRLLRRYANSQLYLIESRRQNLRISKYFEAGWKLWKAKYGRLLRDVIMKPRRLLANDVPNLNPRLSTPRLPIDKFGEAVDDEWY